MSLLLVVGPVVVVSGGVVVPVTCVVVRCGVVLSTVVEVISFRKRQSQNFMAEDGS